ncbi:C40 family peptidase [Cohnella sp. GCM10027633]|uniref:C40 family peptidase n=1 Tax=unclassified Cohnella TaxID=2636738 RepID=UPI00363028C5
MFAPKPIFRQLTTLGLCAAIGFGAIGIGQAQLAPTASAATTLETKVTLGVNLRVGPSASTGVIRMIKTGEKVHVVGQANSNWLHVFDKYGNSGYISSADKYTNYAGPSGGGSAPSSSKGAQVVSIAKSYKGRVDYAFGVRNPSKLIFDCSSFTEFVFAKVGVDLKWGTGAQKKAGSFASKSSLRAGDLVFFDTVGSNNGVINHVGIYMGNGQMVHNTPSKNGVTTNSITSGYWSQHYVTARRVL